MTPRTTPIITAIASGSGGGRSERALVRLSGPGTHDLGQRLLDDFPRLGHAVGACRFRLTDALRVPCLAMRFDAPRSFTGEDAIEIVLPGNPALLGRIIARLLRETGVREATPGEFSARAFLNNRLSIDQAEGLAATIAARTEHELGAAAELLSGRTGSTYRAWSDELAALLALVEAGIDFTDQEDVVPIAPHALAARLHTLADAVAAHLGTARSEEHRTGTPRIVLAGEPNAGKSTLFNALLGRTRAVVAPVAGTTRDALAEELDLSHDVPGEGAVTLVDLAGLDAALADGTGTTIDRAAQQAARAEIARADAIVWCDPTGRFASPLPEHRARTVIRVITKADLPGHGTPRQSIPICAFDGWNLGTLKRALADAAWHAEDGTGAWLLPRHRRVLTLTLERLHEARATFDAAAHALGNPELTASALRSALDLLGEIAGKLSPDDIIGRVFATFCVGK